ncbi:RNA-binding S4 domain-containing protein [Ottowia thiooxydans]|uniref:RNA-binding S4 domain-containing protein n=1 Tax=Ottowia thiooxydans TaxID=219182 RepID=UPI00040F4C7A|nr:RNA-binding S4 domain-containing protein [Ottowia thiooxydans]
MAEILTKQRIDKWLWAARFYKTRALAVEQLDNGRVEINGLVAKPAREVKAGDTVRFRRGADELTVIVQALSAMRGPAPIAQLLYEETVASSAARAENASARRLAPEPANTIEQGRPTKRDRRALDQQRGWGDRWSASMDDEP